MKYIEVDDVSVEYLQVAWLASLEGTESGVVMCVEGVEVAFTITELRRMVHACEELE